MSARPIALRAFPTVSPLPKRRCSALSGRPALCINDSASLAMRGVCSAGFASTVLPAPKAATICPTNIANGKFHGEMATTVPRALEAGFSVLVCKA